MSDVKSVNIPVMTVGGAVDMLSRAYGKLVSDRMPIATFPSVMLWGAPGVGKSQGVRQIAERIAKLTGKRTSITDVRLLLFNPIDLRGIPTANADKTLAVWLKPKIFDMDESGGVVNILFLDEISAASQTVQAAAYQITLDRVVGEHKLPDNCIVIAAGNRLTDKSVAYKMPKALANRLMHIEIDANFDSWRNWAVYRGINEKIIGFLAFRRSFLLQEPASEDLAYPTPRSWEMASNILNYVEPDVQKARKMICGLVGGGATSEFITWCDVYSQLPDIEDIFAGKHVDIPRGTDVLYALVSSITNYARVHRNDMKAIAHAARFGNMLPPDFSAVLLKDFLYLEEGYKNKLVKLPEFVKWLSDKGRLLNGNI